MVAKKVVKKKRAKKVVRKARPKVVKKKLTAKKAVRIASKQRKKLYKNKLRIIINNLILFSSLLIVSLVLYSVSTKDLYINLFKILTLLFGFVIIAFLITLLIFFFLRMKR